MFDNVWQWITPLIPLALTGIVSVLTSYLKKGQFERIGNWCGRTLSKFADSKLGKDRWEKLEDVITVAIVSFAIGFKKGADFDDGEIQTLIDDPNMVGKLNQNGDKK